VDAPNGTPIFPPEGIDEDSVEKIQKEIRGACKTYIDPEYQPLIIPEIYQDKRIIIISIPAGDNRPYQAPNDRKPGEKCYFVRQGPESIKATGEVLRQLLEQTARIPFDDRRNLEATLLDLSPILVKRFLQEVNSDLINAQPALSDLDLYKALRIISQQHEKVSPKNVGLLYFNEKPSRYFSGGVFEVVQFADDAGGNLIEEKRFEGPLDTIILSVLNYLDNLTNNVQLRKIPRQAAVERIVSYPYEALEEAITNAVYHRGYENTSEPSKVYLYPDRIEIISYPGPVPGLTLSYLENTNSIPQFPARNRRIGEFLKELKLAEMRGTGIPKIRRTMSLNGSPPPVFDFDEERTYFRIVLPAHPSYVLLHALREGSYLWSIGERKSAISKLRSAFEKDTGSGAITSQLIEYLWDTGDTFELEKVFQSYNKNPVKSEIEQPYLKYVKLLLSSGQQDKAKQVLETLPESDYEGAPLDVAIAFKRLKMFDRAHIVFSKIYREYETNPIYLQDYAQTKLSIADEMARRRAPQWETVKRLRSESVELLRRTIALSQDKVQKAWCYINLAKTLDWLRYPRSQVQESYENAIQLIPTEKQFKDFYKKWKDRAK
jgi:ATP-dependent DNA helicase RecG